MFGSCWGEFDWLFSFVFCCVLSLVWVCAYFDWILFRFLVFVEFFYWDEYVHLFFVVHLLWFWLALNGFVDLLGYVWFV